MNLLIRQVGLCWSPPLLTAWLTAAVATPILAGPVAAEEGETRYPLSECIDQALESSRMLRVSIERQTGADADADQARARRWPTLAFEANGMYVSEVNEIELPLIPPRTLKFGNNDSYDLAAGVRIPLYTGGTLSATERALRAAAEASAYDVSADSLRLVHDVRRAFLGALGAEEEARAAQLAVDRLHRHTEEISGRIELGAASEEMKLGAESRLRIAEQQLVGAKERLIVARLGLGALLGRPKEPIMPAGSLDDHVSGPEGMGLESDGPPPVDARPELRALERKEQASDQSRRAATGSFLPTVSAVAQVHYGKPGVQVTKGDWMDWATAGVQLTWTLWDAGTRAAEVRSRSAETRGLMEARAELREQLESALAVAREQVASRQEQLARAGERVELERRRLELVLGRNRQGLGSESELLDVQDDLTEAEVALAAARAGLRIAETDLLYAVGQ